MKKLTLILFLILVSSRVVHAAMPPTFHTGRISLTADAEYFWTSANFDEEGDSNELFNDYGYNNLSTIFGATYFLPEGWALGGGFGYAYAESEGFQTRSNGVLTHIYVVGQKLFSFSPVRLIPEIKGTFTLDKVEEDDDEVLASEGANELQVGSWMTVDFWRLRSYGYLGYAYRDDGRSSLLPWRVGLGFRQSVFSMSAEISGAESISDDDYTDDEFERTQTTSSANAGSLRYYSINPSWMEVRVQGGIEFIKNWIFNIGYAQTLVGENTADGQTVFANLTFNIDTMAPTTPSPARQEFEPKSTPRQKDSRDVRPRRQSDDKREEFQPILEDDYNSVFEGDN